MRFSQVADAEDRNTSDRNETRRGRMYLTHFLNSMEYGYIDEGKGVSN